MTGSFLFGRILSIQTGLIKSIRANKGMSMNLASLADYSGEVSSD
jgi:hypothetical protein